MFVSATTDNFSNSIKEGYNILHYSGHGHPEYLAFEDGSGGTQPVKGEWIKRVVALVGTFQLGIVSACHSEEIARELVLAGIPHVVAVKLDTPVLDKAAIVFTREFYRHLFGGATIQFAFDMAKLMVEGDPTIQRVQPYIEAEATVMGETFTPESEKFLILPDETDFSRHQQAVCTQIAYGTVVDKTPSPSPNNLPSRPTFFRGRTREMYELVQETMSYRLVSLVGAAGIGKTTLALEVLRWFSARRFFPDGVFCIDAREANSVADLLPKFSEVLGCDITQQGKLAEAITQKHMLILLDNLEDLLWSAESEVRNLFDRLLRLCPNLKLMITSQRAIGTVLHEPEKITHISALSPPHDAALFVAVARRHISQEEIASEHFTKLLSRLGGHPLSIVIMARQLTDSKSLADLDSLLEQQRARQITIQGLSGAAGKNESLVAALSTAHGSLSEDARLLFATMGLLPSGLQKSMLSAILPTPSAASVDELFEASLIEYTPTIDRYWQLPPIRMFAEDSVTEDQQEMLFGRVFDFTLSLCYYLREHCLTEEGNILRFAVSIENPNFRAAFDRIIEKRHLPSPQSLFVFVYLLIELHQIVNQYDAIPNLAEKAVALLEETDMKKEKADLLCKYARAQHLLGYMSQAEGAYDRAIDALKSIREEKQDAESLKQSLCIVLFCRADLKMRCGMLDPALEDIKEAEELMACERSSLLADVHRCRSMVFFRKADFANAVTSSAEALARLNEATDASLLDRINSLNWHGGVLLAAGEPENAEKFFSEALQIADSMSDSRCSWQVFEFRGHLRLMQGHVEEVLTDAERGFRFYEAIHDSLGQGGMLLMWAIAKAYSLDIPSARTLMEKAFENFEINADWHDSTQWLLYHVRHTMNFQDAGVCQFLLEIAETCAERTTDDALKAIVTRTKEMKCS